MLRYYFGVMLRTFSCHCNARQRDSWSDRNVLVIYTYRTDGYKKHHHGTSSVKTKLFSKYGEV